MEPIEHPPGHEIERLNREIEEQYSDAEWTPASTAMAVLLAAPFVAFGIYVLVAAGMLVPVLIIAVIVFGLCLGFPGGTGQHSVTEAGSR